MPRALAACFALNQPGQERLDARHSTGGGILLQVGQLAHAFRIPYASHGGGPVQLNVMACLPNAMYLETGLIGKDSPLTIENGFVSIPNGPGFSWETR